MSSGPQIAFRLFSIILACLGIASAAAAQPASSRPVEAQSVSAVQTSPLTLPYRLNPGDQLEIYVWGEERLQREVRVLPDGTFTFPLVGQVSALGKLPEEVEQIIAERLKGQYRGQVPQVTVSVKSPAGLQFSVMGRVRTPGTFSPGRYVTVLEALSLAGGPAEFANLDSVLLIRKRGDRLSAIHLRLSPLFRAGADDADLARANLQRIETGDTIIVP